MSKLKLEAQPTFKAKVGIPVPGSEPALVEFTFKHRTRNAVQAWLAESSESSDVQSVQDVATGWDLDDAFNADNIDKLCQNYAGAGFAIVSAYLEELRGARTKN